MPAHLFLMKFTKEVFPDANLRVDHKFSRLQIIRMIYKALTVLISKLKINLLALL